jgi:hypothetical protein
MTTNEQAMRQQLVRYQKVYNTRMAWSIWAKEEQQFLDSTQVILTLWMGSLGV